MFRPTRRISSNVLFAKTNFPFHAQVHDNVLKNIAVFANKTLLEILLVGLNVYLTIGEHSIAYTDLNKIYRKVDILK